MHKTTSTLIDVLCSFRKLWMIFSSLHLYRNPWSVVWDIIAIPVLINWFRYVYSFWEKILKIV